MLLLLWLLLFPIHPLCRRLCRRHSIPNNEGTLTVNTLCMYVCIEHYMRSASVLRYGKNWKYLTFQQTMDMVMRTRVIDFIKSHSLQNRCSAFEGIKKSLRL